MAVAGDHVAIGHPHRGLQHRVGDRAVVHGHRLHGGGGTVDRGRADEAAEPVGTAGRFDRQQGRGRFGAEQRGDAGSPILRRQVEAGPPVEFQPDRDSRRGEGKPPDRGFRVVGLGARVLEEFAPRRGGEEQVPHHDAGAERTGGGGRFPDDPAFDADRGGMRRIARAGGDGEPRRRADRGQRLAPEPQRGDADQALVVEL